jgi:hypothetical protein
MSIMDWLARKILPPSLFDLPQGEDRLVPDSRQERARAERERERAEADRALLERIEAVNAEVRMHERQLRQ